MNEDEKQKTFAAFGSVIVKLKNAADLNTGVELAADEVKAFLNISQFSADFLAPPPKQLADDDFPEAFGDDAETFQTDVGEVRVSPNPDYVPPLLPQSFDTTSIKTEFDFVRGETLDEFKVIFNELVKDSMSFQVIGDINRNAKGYYQPILVTRKVKTESNLCADGEAEQHSA